ncbi:hypothetical protein [Terrabacter sp. C0L_2]|uniref:hypothetical protein n=1 Tax=Terrabacter sp. C0L_2 TaxID=3108389 RepID=UPI002ED0B843|nr:hypothetical protein U5C87_07790 [Terrabacter sp. C0L_2]
MSNYAVDSKRAGLRSTGIVNEVREWEERDGKRRPSEMQARDEATGMPLWQVEVVYKQTTFGRESMTTGVVELGCPHRPVLAEFAPVEFVDLTVEVRVNKAGGLSEMWRADRLVDEGKAAGQAPGQSNGSASGSSGQGSKAA